jgi:leucyl aminopeptidase
VLATLVAKSGSRTIPIVAVSRAAWRRTLSAEPANVRAWAHTTHFTGEPGSFFLVPTVDGGLARVLLVLPDASDGRSGGYGGDPSGAHLWTWACLPARLPVATYRIDGDLPPGRASEAALGWALGSYGFLRYGVTAPTFARLAWPKGADRGEVERAWKATYLVRDLVTTPASDMGPEALAQAAVDAAHRHGARVATIVGDKLLDRNYPMIHAVGRASASAPRLVDITWGERAAPRVTLVGKGVCFDTGGLDLKPSSGMKMMKKDMAGAAQALGLGTMIMAAGLDVRLRILLPIVENSVSGNAFRPLDVLKTRKGITVEVGNTDAEGRLILADALTEAVRDEPDLLCDFSTLTGAARTALGTEVPALFSNDRELSSAIQRAGEDACDPVWPLPLWRPYRDKLSSKVASLNNISEGPYAGAITAALFLNEFVSPRTPWAHLDFMGWNDSSRPGRPEGGEAQGMRGFYRAIAERFAKHPRRR